MAARYSGFALAILVAAVQVSSALAADSNYKLLKIDGQTVRWHGGADAEITYAFLSEGRMTGTRNCRPMTPIGAVLEASGVDRSTIRSAARRAFERWAAVANLRFVERSAPPADIVIGSMADDRGVAFADVTVSPGDGGDAKLTQALICLNPHEVWNAEIDGDEKTREFTYVLTHEIGHAIGLDHPGRRGALMAFGYDENADDLTAGDIRAARLLYGSKSGSRDPVPAGKDTP